MVMKIDFAIQTSERTRDRWPLLENWTKHVQKPSRVRMINDEHVKRGDYFSAIDKTLYALATYEPYFDWLYIVDDDGYVVVHRLEDALCDYHPDKLHAAGCSRGKLCHEDAKFPTIHGGCGMALSRGVATRLQQMLWHDDIVRHPRSSDGTIAINLHRMRVIPTDDPRWTSSVAKEEDTETFVACHRIINHPEHLIHLPRLNAQQRPVEKPSKGDI
jgi:hypothetical protein